MTDDLISRQAAIDELWKALYEYEDKTEQQFQDSDELDIGDWIVHRIFVQNMSDIDRQVIRSLPSAQPEQRWIPVKTRPMTEGEWQYWEEHTGVELEAEDAVFFDCQMPDDGQEIWVCYKGGTVSEDVCESDDFCGLEGNGDWSDIVAWMPRIKPDPWKGKEE